MTRVYLKSLTTLLNSGPLHPTLLLPGKGNYSDISGNLRKKGHFDPDVYETIYPSGSQPARIYGLPKMHKPRAPNSTPPFRPIVSSIGTYNYSLAKYLSNLLQPHIPSILNFKNTIILFVVPPKFCISIVFNFSCDL